jgi:hypothetical protein
VKLTVFQSDKGDCMLVTGDDGTNILVDGGMQSSYTEHVAPFMDKLREDGQSIDLVYVSHIDSDHIGGVLQMMDDLVATKVFEFQTGKGRQWKKPEHTPPGVARVWHNSFKESVSENAVAIADLLATTASLLKTSTDPEIRGLAERNRELATSVPQAIKLRHRLSEEQLGIPVNEEFGGKLIYVKSRGAPQTSLGNLNIRVIAPFKSELDALREEWDDWLKANKEQLGRLQDQMQRDAERIGNEVAVVSGETSPPGDQLGDIRKVTPPNLASLMLHVTEDHGPDVLLTGDGHPQHILEGLKRHKLLNGGGPPKEAGVHLRVLKVPHHASENNMTPDFARRVTADHYITCGNGAHKNPDLAALTALIDARLSDDPAVRTANAGADGQFTMWFNSSSTATEDADNKAWMKGVEKLVSERAAASGGRMKFEFLDEDSFELPL